MYCENCGTQMNLGKFCPKCGCEAQTQPVQEDAPQSAPVEPLPQFKSTIDVLPNQLYEDNQQTIEKKKKEKKEKKPKFALRAWHVPISAIGAFSFYLLTFLLIEFIFRPTSSSGYAWRNILISLDDSLSFSIIPIFFFMLSLIGLKKPLKIVSTPTLSIFYFMCILWSATYSIVWNVINIWENAGYVDQGSTTFAGLSSLISYPLFYILGTVIAVFILKKIEKYYRSYKEKNMYNFNTALQDESTSLPTETPVEDKKAKLSYRFWFVPVVILVYELVFKFAINPFITNIFQTLSNNAATEGYDSAYCSSLNTIGTMIYDSIHLIGIIVSVIVFYLIAFINVKGLQRKACAGIKYIPLGAFGVISIIYSFINSIIVNCTFYFPMEETTKKALEISGDVIYIVTVFLVAAIATLVSYFILKGVEKIPESVEK